MPENKLTCVNHADTQERVGMLETEIENLKIAVSKIERYLEDIIHKLDSRYPSFITYIMSVMTFVIGILATALFDRL